jgi:hypothetical protein
MSFEEHDDCFYWFCNGKDCQKQAIFPPTDFWGCVGELHSRGWSFFRDDETGEWTHYCQRCQHKRNQTSIMDQRIRTVK